MKHPKVIHTETVSMAIIGTRRVLFSESRQELYELDEVAAFIWCRSSEGAEVDTIVAEVIERGVSRKLAWEYVAMAFSNWKDLGLVEFDTAGMRSVINSAATWSQAVLVGDTCIEIIYPTSDLAKFISPYFRNLQTLRHQPKRYLKVAIQGDKLSLEQADIPTVLCQRDEIVPAIRGALTAEALDNNDYEVALHVACLISDGEALLLTGPPGAGKSTLAVALACAGLRFAGDDVGLLTSNGRIKGIPFCPAVKSGSWPILLPYRPDIYDFPVHMRYDSKTVRFLEPMNYAKEFSYPIRWVVSLNRQDSADPNLQKLDPVETLRHLIADAFAPGERLKTSAFQSLCRVLANAEGYRFTYSSLDNAVKRLMMLCK